MRQYYFMCSTGCFARQEEIPEMEDDIVVLLASVDCLGQIKIVAPCCLDCLTHSWLPLRRTMLTKSQNGWDEWPLKGHSTAEMGKSAKDKRWNCISQASLLCCGSKLPLTTELNPTKVYFLLKLCVQYRSMFIKITQGPTLIETLS